MCLLPVSRGSPRKERVTRKEALLSAQKLNPDREIQTDNEEGWSAAHLGEHLPSTHPECNHQHP